MRLILPCIIVLLTACKSPTLQVKSDYFTRQDLASYHVDTPDPNKQKPIFGQRLYISWSVTKEQQMQGPLELVVQVMLKKGQMLTKKIPIKLRSGTYIFPIVGDDYNKRGGLLSYKVDLVCNNKVLDTRQHKFWVKKIEIAE